MTRAALWFCLTASYLATTSASYHHPVQTQPSTSRPQLSVKPTDDFQVNGAGDNAVSGQFLYQLYANANKLVGYKIGDDGRLTKVTEAAIPHNSTQGLAVA